VAVSLGFDEALAHRMEAGADALLMPSRFEPCGLNQMYSQRYGTVPVVRATGGLADTVVDATPVTLADGTATGFSFAHADASGVAYGISRALEAKSRRQTWSALQRNGMQRDFGWTRTANRYVELYETLRR
jgi:starch synthase